MSIKSKSYPVILDAIMHLLFFSLIYGSYRYYLERLSGNGSLDLFEVINTGRLFLIHNRFTHLFGQWMPLIALKTGMSVKTAVILFSVSAPLTHYVIFLIARYGLNDKNVAFGIVMVQFFGISSSYFTDPHLEIQYCMSLSLLLYAYIDTKRLSRIWFFIGLSIILFFVILSYPPAFIMALYAIVLKIRSLERARVILVAFNMVAFLIIAYLSLDLYESSVLSYSLVGEKQANGIRDLITYYQFFINNYKVLNLFLAAGLVIAAYRKEWLIVSSTLLFITSYSILILVYYGGNYQLEHINLPVVYFILVLIVYTSKKLEQKIMAPALALLVYIMIKICISIFSYVGSSFEDYVNVMEETIDKTQCLDNNLILLKSSQFEELSGSHTFFAHSMIVSSIFHDHATGILPQTDLQNHLYGLMIPCPNGSMNFSIEGFTEQEVVDRLNDCIRDSLWLNPIFNLDSQHFIYLEEADLCSL